MYEVGDKVIYKLAIFCLDAEILEVYDDNEYDEYKYYIKYTNYENETENVLAREKDIVGYAKGTEKYLKHELSDLLKIYKKESIIKLLDLL